MSLSIAANPPAYQQCTRCVMDTTDPVIRFDADGRCNHCTSLISVLQNPAYKAHFTPENFAALAVRMKKAGRTKKYDCLLGISGGVDSSYLAYLLKQHGLRVLLVHMDNGWDSPAAVHNIHATANRLGFDYDSVVLDWEEFKDIQRAFLKASVIEAETPTDVAIIGALHRKASQYRIRYIISGSNMATEGILPYDWHYNARDRTYLLAVHQQYGSRPLRTLPTFEVRREVWYKFVRGIRMVYPLNYLSYSKDKAIDTLIRELNWRPYGGKHHESLYTKFVQGYLLPLKFGIDYRKATFSSQICAGSLTRDEAIAQLKQPMLSGEEIESEKKFVAKKLDFTLSELEAVVSASPKSFRHYRNNERNLSFLYHLYRRLTKSAWRSFPGSAGLGASLYFLTITPQGLQTSIQLVCAA